MPAVRPFILIADAEITQAEDLAEKIRSLGAETQIVMTLAEAHAAARRRPPGLLFAAESLPDGRGADLAGEGEFAADKCPVVLVLDDADVDDVVGAMKHGVADVLERPIFPGRLQRLIADLTAPKKSVAAAEREAMDLARPPIVGGSSAIKTVLDALKLVTQAPKATVLIEGESGTGKELIARAVHYDSPRQNGPFCAVNCATLNENLLEAELFGYEKGAFTGALVSGKKGLFEAAAGGTLFLDEIGELAPGMQAKLLRVLQEGAFKRVGGLADVRVDVRIIAATNRDLRKEVKDGRFRADLFYRLNVVPVRVPPLRERKDDIPELCRFFFKKFAEDLGKDIKGLSPRAEEKLFSYDWPGNIRELRNVCEYAAIVCEGQTIEARHLTIPDVLPEVAPVAQAPAAPKSEGPRDLSLRAMESELIKTVLNETRFNISRAAQMLGINRSTLYNKMRDLGMYPDDRSKIRQSV